MSQNAEQNPTPAGAGSPAAIPGLSLAGMVEDQIRCDALIICQAATVESNRLNVLGGFSDQIFTDFSGPAIVNIALAISIPHHLTGTEHAVDLWWQDMAGDKIGDDNLQLKFGAPPGGRAVRIPAAISIPLQATRPGDVTLLLGISGGAVLARAGLMVSPVPSR